MTNANQTYHESTPPLSLEFEEQLGMPELDDVKLRRTNPKRYDATSDYLNMSGEHEDTSPLTNRYDHPPPLESAGSMTPEEADWMFDRLVESHQDISSKELVAYCVKRHSMKKKGWDIPIRREPHVNDVVKVLPSVTRLPETQHLVNRKGTITHVIQHPTRDTLLETIYAEVFGYQILDEPVVIIDNEFIVYAKDTETILEARY